MHGVIESQLSILFDISFIAFVWDMSYYSRKAPGSTMGSYSGNYKYTETFFHHPTRNSHNELHYEMRMANR